MVDLSGVFAAAFTPIYSDASLHVLGASIDDGTGTITRTSPADVPCKAQLDSATEAMRRAEGFVDTDQRILVLAASLPVQPSTDNEITAGGRRWKIASVGQDPARTYWELRGRRTGG